MLGKRLVTSRLRVADRPDRCRGTPSTLDVVEGSADRKRHERVTVAADNLRVDAVTAEVLQAFDAAAVSSVLLKGPAIARWLYLDGDPRPYRDCDLLVPPSQIDAAQTALGRAGLNRAFDLEGLPDWWREHAGEWWSPEHRVYVDLHRTLPGVGVDDEAAWRILSADTETIVVGGQPAKALGLPARALHIALHAAQHGEGFHKPMADLGHALAGLDVTTWRGAAAVAERLEATDALAAGLRLLPAGRELAGRLDLPSVTSVEVALRAGTAPPVALGFEQLARARGVRARGQILWRKFFPPPGFMRRWHPIASRGRPGLALAYLLRPVWIIRAAPRGLRAWRRARRDTSGR